MQSAPTIGQIESRLTALLPAADSTTATDQVEKPARTKLLPQNVGAAPVTTISCKASTQASWSRRSLMKKNPAGCHQRRGRPYEKPSWLEKTRLR